MDVMFDFFKKNFKPISIKSKKIIGKNTRHLGLWDIEVKLNKTPGADWINFYTKPNSYTPAISPPNLDGNKIITSCEKCSIETNYEWILNYIEQANNRYREFIEKRQKEEAEKRKQRKIEKDDLKRLRGLFLKKKKKSKD